MDSGSIHIGTRFLKAAVLAFAMTLPGVSFAQGTCNPDSSLSSVSAGSAHAATLEGSSSGAFSKWEQARESCKSANVSAQTQCTEACSPHAQSGITAANGISGGASGDTGGKEAADRNVAGSQALQGAFNSAKAACTSTKDTCDSSCKSAVSAGKAFEAAAKADNAACQAKYGAMVPPNTGKMTACSKAYAEIQRMVAEDNKESAKGPTVGGKVGQCKQELSNNLADMLKMLTELLNAIMQAMNKGEEYAATEDPVVAATLDCSKEENKKTQKCICEADPRTYGCPNNLAKAGEGDAFASLAGNDVTLPMNQTDAGATLPNTDMPSFPSGVGDSGAAAAGMLGGGMGGMGGGGAGGSKDAEKAGAAGSGLKADIYSGEGGGGGGGAGGWASGSSADGGRGRRGTASAAGRGAAGVAPPKYVTGSGGRTNFEKVKIRYGENRPTFLNE